MFGSWRVVQIPPSVIVNGQFDHASLHRVECPGDKHMQLREGQKFLGR